MQTMTARLDDDDARAVHAAIARRQARRVDGECVLPEGGSDTAGLCLGEICRDWLDAHPPLKQ